MDICLSHLAIAAGLALLCLQAPLVAADSLVACDENSVRTVCPADYPVCCAWPENAVVAACCSQGSVCDIDEGLCLRLDNTTASPPGQAEGGITLSVSTAAGLLTAAMLLFMCLLIFAMVTGWKCHFRVERRRQRREDAEREALVAAQRAEEQAQDDEDEEEDDLKAKNGGLFVSTGNEDDDDEHGMCKICFCKRSNCVLMECGHVCCCIRCAVKLTQCPICREDIKRRVKLQTVPKQVVNVQQTSANPAPVVAAVTPRIVEGSDEAKEPPVGESVGPVPTLPVRRSPSVGPSTGEREANSSLGSVELNTHRSDRGAETTDDESRSCTQE